MDVLDDLGQAIISGDRERAKALVEKARGDSTMTREIVVNDIAAAMEVVGEEFRADEFFVPELLIAQPAMKEALAGSAGQEVDHIGTVVIGTVKGGPHDIGKSLVAAVLEGAGFKIIDLGVDVAPDKFAAAVKEYGADTVTMSALLATTVGTMTDTVALLASDAPNTKMIIGGAPVTQAYVEEIGAHRYSANAAASAELAKSPLGVQQHRRMRVTVPV